MGACGIRESTLQLCESCEAGWQDYPLNCHCHVDSLMIVPFFPSPTPIHFHPLDTMFELQYDGAFFRQLPQNNTQHTPLRHPLSSHVMSCHPHSYNWDGVIISTMIVYNLEWVTYSQNIKHAEQPHIQL